MCWTKRQPWHKAVIPEAVISLPNTGWRFICVVCRLEQQQQQSHALYQLYVWRDYRENARSVKLWQKQRVCHVINLLHKHCRCHFNIQWTSTDFHWLQIYERINRVSDLPEGKTRLFKKLYSAHLSLASNTSIRLLACTAHRVAGLWIIDSSLSRAQAKTEGEFIDGN